jgi:hypothetical protein
MGVRVGRGVRVGLGVSVGATRATLVAAERTTAARVGARVRVGSGSGVGREHAANANALTSRTSKVKRVTKF